MFPVKFFYLLSALNLFKSRVILELKKGKIVSEESLFPNRFGRIRDIRVGPKGYIYFLTDETDGGLYKISSLD